MVYFSIFHILRVNQSKIILNSETLSVPEGGKNTPKIVEVETIAVPRVSLVKKSKVAPVKKAVSKSKNPVTPKTPVKKKAIVK